MLAARPLGFGPKLAKTAGLLGVLAVVVAGGPLVDAALLTRGSGSLAVLSVATGVDQRELADAYVREYLAPASANLVVTAAELVPLGRSRLARRFAYRGQFEGAKRRGGLAGEVTTLVSPLGTGVVFDAWAEADVYPYERGDARAMVARAAVR